MDRLDSRPPVWCADAASRVWALPFSGPVGSASRPLSGSFHGMNDNANSQYSQCGGSAPLYLCPAGRPPAGPFLSQSAAAAVGGRLAAMRPSRRVRSRRAARLAAAIQFVFLLPPTLFILCFALYAFVSHLSHAPTVILW